METVTSALVIGVASLLGYWFWKAYKYTKTLSNNGIPGPTPWPLLGNTRELMSGGLMTQFINWGKKYGDFYGVYMPGPTVVISNLEILRDVFVKKFSNFHNRMPEAMMNFKPWSDNLLMLRDDHWKHVRTQLSPTFSSNKLKKMFPAIDRVVQNLKNYVESNAESGEDVELKFLASGFAMDTIAGAAFGIQVDTLKDKEDPFGTHGENLFKQRQLIVPLLMVFPRLGPILRKFDLGLIPNKPTDFFMEVMEMALRERRADKKQSYGDFLQLLIDAEREVATKGQQQVDAEIDHTDQLKTGNTWTRTTMTDDEMKANAFLFLLAGYDTVSTVFSFSLFFLANYPDCLKKAQKEVDEKLGDGKVDYNIAAELDYVDMCMNEAMRLFPPGFMVDRETDEDITLGSYRVEKGTRVVVPCFAIHRDPQYWEDPDKFDPERHTPEQKAKRHPFCFMPFGLGPRNCIGMRLAQLEIRMAIATVIQSFDPVLCEKSVYPPVVASPQTRMIAEGGLWVKFQPRQ